ncbi:DUF4974 domain-containing protein [Chitinophaga sp. Mgbs1]|uniref:DUF4974 domain-containing protein n=1 Tax=Chitinophaga solisilvae TaxID=1233460 RepID=A0A433WL75_9BACT|nr:DUF4974 domain-containing protein [Chitinophaga solisilvae]
MKDANTRLAYLYNLWCKQQLTEEERAEYSALLEEEDLAGELEPLMMQQWDAAVDEGQLEMSRREAIAQRILSDYPVQTETVTRSIFPVPVFRRWRSAAAAAVVVMAAAGMYFMLHPGQRPVAAAVSTEIGPGHEGAILTLADGSQVVLDSLPDGVIASQQGATAVMTNGRLSYNAGQSSDTGMVYNTMSTPRGRQFRMVLPDGTKVWLNAVTSLKYPTAFKGKERVVEVSGEAYFEVAKDESKPFRVQFTSTAGNDPLGTVLALGTSFNVSAYYDDPAAKITLLDGKVMVSPAKTEHKDKILVPGQQAAMAVNAGMPGNISVHQADTAKVNAWRYGILNMHQMGLAEVMKQISRWYNVDIVYEDSIPDITFWGEINRTENLTTVLGFMAESGVKFSIVNEGRKIIIQKK